MPYKGDDEWIVEELDDSYPSPNYRYGFFSSDAEGRVKGKKRPIGFILPPPPPKFTREQLEQIVIEAVRQARTRPSKKRRR